jgi:hypothetical protein
MLNVKRLLNTELGRFFVSVMLGIGLATLFRKACTDKNCIVFNGPVIDEVDGKTYKFGEFCYQYKLIPSKCDPTKKTVEIGDAPPANQTPSLPSILLPQQPVESKSWF